MVVRPAIIWGLDEEGRRAGQDWLKSAGTGVGPFLRVVATREDVIAAVHCFNQAEFSRGLETAQLTLEPGGRKVTVVLLAEGLGPSAFDEWPDVFTLLANLQRDVHGIEPHVVLLAHHEHVRTRERTLKTDGIPIAPWLLSTRTQDGTTVSRESLQGLVSELLDVLLLSDRRETTQGALGTVFDVLAVPSEVRLVGRLRESLLDVTIEIAELYRDVVLRDIVAVREPSPNAAESVYRAAMEGARGVRRGERSADQWMESLFGVEGLGGWTLGALTMEGPGLLKRVCDGVRAISPRREPERTTAPGIWAWVRRMVGRIIRGRGRVHVEPRRTSRGEDCSALRAAIGVVEECRGFLVDVNARAWAAGSITEQIPEARRHKWRSELLEEIRSVLSNSVAGVALVENQVDELLRRLQRRLVSEVADEFSTMVGSWGLCPPRLRRLNGNAGAEEIFVFSAKVGGAGRLEPCAIVSSVDAEGMLRELHCHTPFARVRSTLATRPLLLTVAHSVDAQYIEW